MYCMYWDNLERQDIRCKYFGSEHPMSQVNAMGISLMYKIG
jgi:hypothetical protein